MKQELHAFIFGKVQGVGFRYFTKRNALKLGINGFARNLPDSSVEVIAQGTKEQLDIFLGLLHKGSSFSLVNNITFTKDMCSNNLIYNSFEIW